MDVWLLCVTRVFRLKLTKKGGEIGEEGGEGEEKRAKRILLNRKKDLCVRAQFNHFFLSMSPYRNRRR